MSDMPGRFPAQSRYAKVAGHTRRSFLGIGLGALATLVGCRSSEDDVFSAGNAPVEGDGVGATEGSSPGSSTPAPTEQPAATLEVQLDGEQAGNGEGSGAVAGDAAGSSTGSESGGTTSSSPASSETTAATGETSSSSTAGQTQPSTTRTEGPTTTTTEATTSTTTSTTASTTATTRPSGPATALPSGSDLAITFTYEQQEGGKNVPPYMAVWIEDDGGNLVETVALWYQQFGRGETWLPDLRRWYNVTGGSLTDSGPTRPPGQHQVAWGGSSEFGEPMTPGRYYVCVESARERGPYSLVRTAVDLNGSGVDVQLGADGELKAVSARTT